MITSERTCVLSPRSGRASLSPGQWDWEGRDVDTDMHGLSRREVHEVIEWVGLTSVYVEKRS